MPFDGKQSEVAALTSPASDNWNKVPFDHIMTLTSHRQVPGRFAFCAGGTLKLATVADAAVYLAPGYYVFCRKGDDGGPLAPVVGELKRWKRHGCDLVGWPRKPVFVRFADYPLVWRVVGSDPRGPWPTHFPRAAVPMAWAPSIDVVSLDRLLPVYLASLKDKIDNLEATTEAMLTLAEFEREQIKAATAVSEQHGDDRLPYIKWDARTVSITLERQAIKDCNQLSESYDALLLNCPNLLDAMRRSAAEDATR